MTSAYQTAILLQFNGEDTLSLEELMTATELPKEEIIPVLNLLCKGKVLLDGEDQHYDLNPTFQTLFFIPHIGISKFLLTQYILF